MFLQTCLTGGVLTCLGMFVCLAQVVHWPVWSCLSKPVESSGVYFTWPTDIFMVTAPLRGRDGASKRPVRVRHFSCLVFYGSLGGGGVGWGMLTFMGLAHLRDATLLHALFKVYNYVILRYCTFSSRYTTTWCYATARSLQGIQLRDATLLHVLFKVYNYVMLRYCTFSSRYTTTWCYATARSLQVIQLRDATLLHGPFKVYNYVMLRSQALLLHLRTLVMLRCGRWGLLGVC